MYKATDKSPGITPAALGLGSPAPGTTRQAAGGSASAPPAKRPAIANRRLVVPPLKLEETEKMPVISSPDPSPPSSPTRTYLLPSSTSPRKVLRSLSEKASAAKTRVESAVSPRARTARMLDGVEWIDLGEPAGPEHPASPESTPSRKRKAENDGAPGNAKKVRFDDRLQVKRAKGSTSGKATDYTQQIDQLVADLGKPIGKPIAPPPRPKSAAPAELTPISQLLEAGFGTPSHRKRPAELVLESRQSKRPRHDLPLPAVTTAVTTATGMTADPGLLLKPSLELAETLDKELEAYEAAERRERLASSKHSTPASSAGFPFPPDRLGQLAIKQRAKGREWVGKATGDSLAAKLQGTLDRLRADNAGSIDNEACGYVQEMFGLLPAGVGKAGKTFHYMLMKAFYSLGLNDAQWQSIERLHRDFDQLDTRHDPRGCAALKTQLGEIVSAKQGLVYMRQQAEVQASGNARQ